MKIKILLFVNLVLIGTAIVLYINRSTGPGTASAVTGTPSTAASTLIPAETPAPCDTTGSNVPPQSVDKCETNTIPKTDPQAKATRQNRPIAIEKDFAPAHSLF
jgi:hypothetical protein